MKKQQYRWPLAVKLTLTAAFVVMVIAIGLSHIFTNRGQHMFRTELQQQMRMLLNTLTITAAEPLLEQNEKFLQSVATQLYEEQMVISIRFYNPAGQILAEASTQARSPVQPKDYVEEHLMNPEAPMFEWLPDRLAGWQTIVVNDQRVGAVNITLSTTPIYEKTSDLRKQGMKAALLATALAVLLALVVSRTITKPLALLVDAANRLAAGGLNQRIKIRTHDELATLGMAMEHMRAELQELYSTLELEVSERTRALEDRTQQLSELNAAKDTFFTILSHDLQTPISGLLELSTFIPENLENLDQAELKETIDTMRTSLENFHELLKNLFTWSGIQRGTIKHRPQIIHVHNTVQRNISLLMPLAEEKHVRLKNDIAADITAYADSDMVYAIIRSLLSNALKFTFPGDSIQVSATAHQNDLIEISVADTGVGIHKDDLPKLFRSDISHQTPGTAGEEGTGVGLLLCKELVEQNGGSIGVESEVGEGTTFRFTLPRPPDTL